MNCWWHPTVSPTPPPGQWQWRCSTRSSGPPIAKPASRSATHNVCAPCVRSPRPPSGVELRCGVFRKTPGPAEDTRPHNPIARSYTCYVSGVGVARMGSTQHRCVSLFSGIGGLDLGLELSGFSVGERCESWTPAQEVLRSHWPSADVHPDVQTFQPSEGYDLLAGGFPCTDVSHAGRKAGVDGSATRLVHHVFRIARYSRPTWILLENVPNLLRLHSGLGIRTVVDALESLGYRWAYRTVDSRFTGVPQRRPRVIILASASEDPASVLLADDAGPPPAIDTPTAWGFYWTEGRFGVGAVAEAVPTLKGGSTLGLPSAPAVWTPSALPGEKFKVVGVGDGEALQGLSRGWTDAAVDTGAIDHRWKLVANAVTVGVARWVGTSIVGYSQGLGRNPAALSCDEFARTGPWPPAAAGEDGRSWPCSASVWPRREPPQMLLSAISPSATTLSHRAVTGFLNRIDRSGLRLPDHMYSDLEEHQRVTRPRPVARSGTSRSSPANRA